MPAPTRPPGARRRSTSRPARSSRRPVCGSTTAPAARATAAARSSSPTRRALSCRASPTGAPPSSARPRPRTRPPRPTASAPRSSAPPPDPLPMCEQYVAVAATPFRIADLWPFTERLEKYGLAGFGWGATWLAGDDDGGVGGPLRSHRDIGAFRDDPARERVGSEMTRALLVHLRRLSKFSTIGIPDTQPFDDPAGRYAFSHNGDFTNDRALRSRYRKEGRLLGKADTEVGARWLEDEWAGAATAPAALEKLHDVFG